MTRRMRQFAIPVPVPVATDRRGRPRPHHCFRYVLGDNVEHSGIRGRRHQIACRVNARFPRPFNYPNDCPHVTYVPTIRSASHSARVAATSTGGTVIAPRRMNSMAGKSTPFSAELAAIEASPGIPRT